MSKSKKEPVGKERAQSSRKNTVKAEGSKKDRVKSAPVKPAPKSEVAKGAKKPVSKKKSAKESVSGSMTPQVMKLVQPHGDYVNPVIIAGKSSIPKQLRGVEPLSRIMRREAKAVLGEDITGLPDENGGVVTINVTAVAIAENAAEILRRFNACDCERCVSALTKLTEEKVPARFVRISKSAAEKDSAELSEQKEPIKKAVVAQMIRVLMGNKKRSFHED